MNVKIIVTLALSLFLPPAVILPLMFGLYQLGGHVAEHQYLSKQNDILHHENRQLRHTNRLLGNELYRTDSNAYFRIIRDAEPSGANHDRWIPFQ